MAKQHRNNRQALVKNPNSQGAVIETTETYDDSLLPDAEEIEKLHKLDPNIVEWLKERAEKEQDFRHVSYSNRVDIIRNNEKNNRTLNTLGLCFAFVIMLFGMGYSAFLVYYGHNVTGTIFGGATILFAAGLFVTRRMKNTSNDASSSQEK